MSTTTLDTKIVRLWKRHPEYIPTDATWLPTVPDDWQVMKLKYLASAPFQYGANEPGGDTDRSAPRFVRITDIDERGQLRDETFCTLARDLAQPYLLRKGDILFARSGATVGKTFRFQESWGEACFAGYLIRFRPRLDRVLPEFIDYFTSTKQYWGWVAQQQLQATIQNLNAERYANLVVPLPPLPEQRAIAAFLDRETSRIDTLIDRKERLIALLEEKRQAAISHAVTRGLDPDAPLKESGVPWVGMIPKHWHIVPLKRRWAVIDCKHRTVDFTIDGYPVASIGEVQGLDIDLTRANRTSEADYRDLIGGGRRPKSGDIIYSRNATVGEAAYVNGDEPFCMGQDVCLITSSRENQRFLLHQLQSPVVAQQLEALMVGATFKRINVGNIRSFLVCCPPRDEQTRIAEFCDDTRSRIGAAISRVRDGITCLQECRTALISAAVTGQIDVRDEVTP